MSLSHDLDIQYGCDLYIVPMTAVIGIIHLKVSYCTIQLHLESTVKKKKMLLAAKLILY